MKTQKKRELNKRSQTSLTPVRYTKNIHHSTYFLYQQFIDSAPSAFIALEQKYFINKRKFLIHKEQKKEKKSTKQTPGIQNIGIYVRKCVFVESDINPIG